MNLDPRHDVSPMQICRICAEVFGFWKDDRTYRWQECGCGRPSTQPRWPGFDFNRVVELCHTCAARPIASGSRWCTYGCASCHPWARDLMARAGRWVIPIGRHSLQHGVGFGGGATPDDETLRQLVAAMGSIFEAGSRLSEWRVRRLADNLDSLGYPSNDEPIPFPGYVDAAVRLPPEAAQTALLEWWAN